MPGADEATTLKTSAALVVGGLAVPAGEHTFYMWVTERDPTLIVNGETGQWHTIYHADRDLGRVPLTLTKRDDVVEQLTFAVEPGAAGGGVLTLTWDTREYSTSFVVRK
jgi:Protein of unknown function (DUF2911)